MNFLYIDGDNVSTKKLLRALPIFRAKFSQLRILYYQISAHISDRLKASLAPFDVKIIPVTPLAKEAADMYIIYHLSYLTSLTKGAHHYVLSDDKAFINLSSLNPNVTVLTLNAISTQEHLLLAHMKKRNLRTLSIAEAGVITKPKRNGYSCTKKQIKTFRHVTLVGHNVHLKIC